MQTAYHPSPGKLLDLVQKFILFFAAGWALDDCHRGSCWLLLMHDGVAQHRSTHCRAIYCHTLVKLPINSEFSTEAGSKCFVLGALSSGLLPFGCS